jgi:hypothetical protein
VIFSLKNRGFEEMAMTDDTAASGSPRMLRMTFEIEVPPGLRRNIQFTRIERAVNEITTAVEVAVRRSFPWASEITVAPEYSYAWWRPKPDTITLPSTADNTV